MNSCSSPSLTLDLSIALYCRKGRGKPPKAKRLRTKDDCGGGGRGVSGQLTDNFLK